MKIIRNILLGGVLAVGTLSASDCTIIKNIKVTQIQKVYENVVTSQPYKVCSTKCAVVKRTVLVDNCRAMGRDTVSDATAMALVNHVYVQPVKVASCERVTTCKTKYRNQRVKTFIGYKNIAYHCGKRYESISSTKLRTLPIEVNINCCVVR